jgi:hypothetical protein
MKWLLTILILIAPFTQAQLTVRNPAYVALLNTRGAAGGGSSTLLTDLAAYWKLDEASGTRVDSYSNAQDLTDNNTVTSTTGKQGNAARFAVASSEYLSRADSTTLSVSDSFTFAFWIRTTTDQATSGFVEKENEYKVSKSGADNIGFTVFDSVSGTTGAVDLGTTINNATWYHVVATYDHSDKKARVYVNNGSEALASTALSNGPKDAAGNFYMGIDTAAGWYDGDLDEVGFWKRVLTPTERTTLYNSGNGVTYPFTGLP